MTLSPRVRSADTRSVSPAGASQVGRPIGAQFVPRPPLIWLFLGTAALLLLAPSDHTLVLAGLGLDALLLVFAILDAALAARVPLEVCRRRPPRLSVGARNPLWLEIHNRSRRPLRLDLVDQPPPEVGPAVEVRSLRVEPFGRAEVAADLYPRARGHYLWGDVHLRVHGALGLAAAQRRIPLSEEVKVYPDLRAATRLVLAGGARDLGALGLHLLRREGEGSEFEMLREYTPGDAFRDIDWKATARIGEPVVRARQPERSQTVFIGIDAGRLMAVRSGALSKLDHAVNAALLLAFVALRTGDRVGLLVFSDEVQTFVPPGKGKSQYRRILEALYAVEASPTYVDFVGSARAILASQRRRALVVTFTEVTDASTSAPLLTYVRRLTRRHLPVIVALRDPALDQEATAGQDPWRMAVAAEMLDEREGLLKGLGTAGARVLDCLPEVSMIRAVNAYVEIKQQQRL